MPAKLKGGSLRPRGNPLAATPAPIESMAISTKDRLLTVSAEMKFIVAGIYTNYTTRIIDDTGIEQEDAFIARPRGNKLVLGFSHI